MSQIDELIAEKLELRSQLVAEREAHARKDAQLSQACKDHLARVQQLAAERSKLAELENALQAIAKEDPMNDAGCCADIAISALAKYQKDQNNDLLLIDYTQLKEQLATAVEALKEIREVALKTDWELAKSIDATFEKITK